MSPHARNWFFAAENFRFFLDRQSFSARHLLIPWDAWNRWPASLGTVVAALGSIGSAAFGLAWRNWLLRVVR